MTLHNCCDDHGQEVCALRGDQIEVLRANQGAILKWVLAVNALMFAIEIVSGILAHSTVLLADSLDMLGDTLVYGFSLYVLARGQRWQAISALAKGSIMGLFAVIVLAEALYKGAHPVVPNAEIIVVVGVLALSANLFCFLLLWRHRTDDLNMSSVWLCSRNDVIANFGVLFAAAGVWLTQSVWPDIVIGIVIAGLFTWSAVQVIARSVKRLRLVEA